MIKENQFPNHLQSKVNILPVVTIPDYNILWYFWKLNPLSEIIDLLTLSANRVGPPAETLTVLCAWLGKWLKIRLRDSSLDCE